VISIDRVIHGHNGHPQKLKEQLVMKYRILTYLYHPPALISLRVPLCIPCIPCSTRSTSNPSPIILSAIFILRVVP